LQVVMHNFWDMPANSQQYQLEFIQFAKNMSILGGLLLLSAGSGARAQRKEKVN
jgi:uncharacterized membrane protein YphA (DoxX/SURF4 family)